MRIVPHHSDVSSILIVQEVRTTAKKSNSDFRREQK